MSERYPMSVQESIDATAALDKEMRQLYLRFGFRAVLLDLLTTVQVNAREGEPNARSWDYLAAHLANAVLEADTQRMAFAIDRFERDEAVRQKVEGAQHS